MRDRFVLPHAAAVILAALLVADGRAAPPSINSLATNTAFTPREQQSIQTYATYWVEQLAVGNENPQTVRTARRRLLDPLRGDLASAMFLDQYGRRIIPLLEDVIAEGNPHVSSNALIVLSQMGTGDALNALLERANVRQEPRTEVRLRAARGCRDVFQSESLKTVSSRMITPAARRLRDAARAETHPLILRHQLEAILAADQPHIDPQQRVQIRECLVEALMATAERAIEAPPDAEPGGMEFFEATYPALIEARDLYLRLDLSAQQQFGKQIGPTLGRLLEIPSAQWQTGQNAPSCKEQCGKIIHLCERFLTTLDSFVRATGGSSPPDTDLRSAWQSNNREQYGEHLRQWTGVLQRPPYE
ncbi:MAG: hypothetical protein GF355_15665 [Candidatus Eisenbacteria bacterium]|nr:hypothetical protein [Candidatus Eisenbacteria bacterium]